MDLTSVLAIFQTMSTQLHFGPIQSPACSIGYGGLKPMDPKQKRLFRWFRQPEVAPVDHKTNPKKNHDPAGP